MTRTRISACIFVVASSLAACTGTGDVEYAGEVQVSSPELIAVSPGVQVIADADEPIFYANNDYWLYRDGYWFRSNDYRRGYVRVEFSYVPQQIRTIEQPQTYAHYRSHMGRDRAARTPDMRTRSQQPQAQPTQPPTYPPPAPSQPSYPTPNAGPPTSPASPVHQPHQPTTPGAQPPGANPTQPTEPPSPGEPTRPPDDNRREPQPQRNAPPDIDHTAPPATPAEPGAEIGHGHGTPPRPTDHAQPSDRADQASPPANNNPDDRTKKSDHKKDKKDKKDKRDK